MSPPTVQSVGQEYAQLLDAVGASIGAVLVTDDMPQADAAVMRTVASSIAPGVVAEMTRRGWTWERSR